jgi:hypothetical protein
MPRSQSHANLRQGLEQISADSQPEPDSSAPAVATAGQHMRRTKSKLGLDTLASVESMNCPIIDYSQLEIKRKIGDGSIGQVSSTTMINSSENHNVNYSYNYNNEKK